MDFKEKSIKRRSKNMTLYLKLETIDQLHDLSKRYNISINKLIEVLLNDHAKM